MPIICPKCHFDNPEDSRFCNKCATPLPVLDDISISLTKTLQTPIKELTTGTIFAGKYKIIEELGRGGMGVVYKAEDTTLKRTVALKFLSPELTSHFDARERFVHEAQAASALDHPNICTIHEVDETEAKQIYIAMAYYKGESLKEKIKQGPLKIEEAIDIATQVAEGLARAHEQGIIHRDIKPANIMVARGGLVKIVDFGLAKLTGTTRITREGMTVGTVAYMSPEQAKGDAIDHRSDIWSLGVMLYEMVIGQLPFRGDHDQAIIYSILNEKPKPAPGLPSELEQFFLKALAKNPAERFKDAEEFMLALEQVGEAIGVKTLRRVSLRKKPLRHKWMASPLLWTSVVVLISIVVGLFLFYPSKTIPFSERDWILITDFDNLTDDKIFDQSLNTALIISLQQSKYVNVFPPARVKETLQRMSKKTSDKLDVALGSEVAVREGIKALVACSVNKLGGVYILNASIIDPKTQVALKTETTQAKGKDEILKALDDLAQKTRKHLGESLKDIKRQIVGLPKATTSSLEALKNYADGQRARSAGHGDEAEALWLKAIELDPDFALAHAYLGVHYYWLNDRPMGEKHFTKALSLLDRLTEREKLWIQAIVPAFRGNRDEAIINYRIYLRKYPDDSGGWHNLGHAYLMLRRCEEAIDALTKSLEIYPNEASTYINIASCLSMMGRYQEAVDNYLKAFEIRPDLLTGGNLNHEFGFTYVEMGEIQKAKETFGKMLSEQDWKKAMGQRSLALLYMYLGKFSVASDHLKEAILLHNTLNHKLSELRDRLYLATVYKTMGNMEAFYKELRNIDELRGKVYVEPWWLLLLGKIYVRIGRLEKANDLLKEISDKMNEKNRNDRAAFNILSGEIELARGNHAKAVDLFKKTHKLRDDNYPLESVAYGYLMSGELDQAMAKYEELISYKDFGWEAQEYWIKAHYQLGKIHEEKGNNKKAIQYYQRFLDIWKDADTGIPEVTEAKKRLNKLKSQ